MELICEPNNNVYIAKQKIKIKKKFSVGEFNFCCSCC